MRIRRLRFWFPIFLGALVVGGVAPLNLRAAPGKKSDPKKVAAAASAKQAVVASFKNAPTATGLAQTQRAFAVAAPALIDVRPSPTSAGKVYFAILASTQAEKIGPGVAANLKFLTSLHARMFESAPERTVTPLLVQDADFNWTTIMTRLSDFVANVGPTDTIFVHVSTHGTYAGDVNSGLDNSKHLMLDLNNQFRSRSDILRVINGKGQLQILLTDSCTSKPGAQPAAAAFTPADDQLPTYALLNLLFNYKGIVNISSSDPLRGDNGQFSWYLTQGPLPQQNGGLFTRQFCISSVYYPDAQTQGWDGFYATMRDATERTSLSVPDIAANLGETPTVFPTP